MTGRTATYFLVAVIAFCLQACNSIRDTSAITPPTEVPLFAVDVLFREFYDILGGADTLGPALTHKFTENGRQCQYTESALMCYNPAQTEPLHRFSLASLGNDLNLVQPASSADIPSVNGRDLGDGFILYPEFEALYDRLYGDLYVGRPLSQVRTNQSNKRYEQFFTNVGFYRNFDDPEGDVHLMTYGAYLCGENCAYNLDQYWNIVKSDALPQPFEMSLKRIGWSEMGVPITQPIFAEDGMVEQYYDNVVVFAPQDDLTQMRLRPVPILLGITVEALVERNPHEQLVFYEVENGLGHNVPFFFDRFIASHGGRDLAGNPINEFTLLGEDLYRQCFENYCLLYDAAAPENTRVKIAPLGAALLEKKAAEVLYKLPRDTHGMYSIYLPLVSGGAYLCGGECASPLDEPRYLTQSDEMAQEFDTSVRRLGWSEIGSPLSPPFLGQDGTVERYYENAVLYAPQVDLGQMRFRPLPLWLNYPVEVLVVRNPHEQLVFYEVENGLGHNVPFFFDHFIASHGGRELAGNPINEFALVGEGLYRQCFENYCLYYDSNQAESARVRMAPLGEEFLKKKNPIVTLADIFNTSTLQIVLEEEKAQVREKEEQHLRIFVMRSGDLAPVGLVEGTVELNLPGKPPTVIHFNATDEHGMTDATLPTITGLPAMSAVEYKVCLNIPGDQPVCAVDSFIFSGP
jgi:hypothetical protein